MLFSVIIFVAFVGSQTIGAYRIESTRVVLNIPNPPTYEEDDLNSTLIVDKNGQIVKIPLDEAPMAIKQFFTADVDVRFELFTPKNPSEPSLLVLDDSTSVKKSNFNRKYPTRILVHGWNSEGLLTPRFAEAYLVKGKHKVNFIALNWQKGSDTLNYLAARNRVEDVAEHLANFINFLTNKHKLNLKDLTLVGHSLGAHIAGIAGKLINGKIAKIVGLDPANVLFKYSNIQGRLHETDANHVEVIHTCAGTIGMTKPIGDADFYPNGGSSQPGCNTLNLQCRHGRSYEYYIESLERSSFLAFQCESFDSMQNGNCNTAYELVSQMGGEPGNKFSEGVFYLETNAEPMYGKGRPNIVNSKMSNFS